MVHDGKRGGIFLAPKYLGSKLIFPILKVRNETGLEKLRVNHLCTRKTQNTCMFILNNRSGKRRPNCPSPGPVAHSGSAGSWCQEESIPSFLLYDNDTKTHFYRRMISGVLMVRAGSPDLLHLSNEASIFNLAGERVIGFPRLNWVFVKHWLSVQPKGCSWELGVIVWCPFLTARNQKELLEELTQH